MFSTKVVHVFRKTRTRFYRVIRQKTRTNIEIDNNPPYHDENFPHQSRVGLRLYQNPSPNSKANRKLSVEPEPRIFSGELIQESKPNPATIGSMPTMGTLTGKPDPAHNQAANRPYFKGVNGFFSFPMSKRKSEYW